MKTANVGLSGRWRKHKIKCSQLTQRLHHSAGNHLLQDLAVRVEGRIAVHLQQPHLCGCYETINAHVKHLTTAQTLSNASPTLKSSSIMKSQPIRSKKPNLQWSFDLTAKKLWVMICCMRFWCIKKEKTTSGSVPDSETHSMVLPPECNRSLTHN